jgi:hypothetical protein
MSDFTNGQPAQPNGSDQSFVQPAMPPNTESAKTLW